KEKENTAYHEAGHAILLCLLEHTEPLHKVTIIPRGPSLGTTMWLPEEDKFNNRKNELLDNLVVTMGGRVAEEIQFGDVTTGASSDIRMATNQARKMVCEWGMSEELGMIEYGSHQEHLFLARDLSGSTRDYSEDTARKIDAEVKLLIDNAYKKAMELILAHRKQLELIALALLEYETLDGHHIHDIMEHGEMKNPPVSPQPPETPEEASDTVEAEADESKAGDEDDLPGDLAPAGA
ncbi:MAG: cell division protein FtsH, partial [Planctomycetes bacterium]|nr:cell division protein FtsH [Planctomycetota bacterium]